MPLLPLLLQKNKTPRRTLRILPRMSFFRIPSKEGELEVINIEGKEFMGDQSWSPRHFQGLQEGFQGKSRPMTHEKS